MTSLSRCAVLLAMGTLITAPLAAQSPGRVQHVSVLGSGPGIEVEIQTSGTVAPQSQMITGPDRIVVDFPGALPAADLRTLNVNRGALKTIRAGLFSSNPPVTRVVLDLLAPQSYQIFSVRNVVMLKVGPVGASATKTSEASLVSLSSEASPVAPPRPAMEVTFHNGLLRIHVERATLAQVLFEVQRQTGAEIAIPAGAESEEIAAELGPAPARDVLAALLNGSRYNFIFVGNSRGRNLQKAILSVR
ncbi:MAG: AMIN domain-containing protein [Terriglobales bacterium]